MQDPNDSAAPKPLPDFDKPVNAARLARQAAETSQAPAEPRVEVEQIDLPGERPEEARQPSVQAAKAAEVERLSQTHTSPRHQIEAWLAGMVHAKASDLILRAGARPSQRVAGKIHFLPGRVPGPGPLLEVLTGVIGEKRMEHWAEHGSADAALHLDGLGRFRLNAYKQMGEPAVVIRRINEGAPDIDELGLPVETLKKLSMRKRGLILVTGIAGSGKSTTLGGMIQYMNTQVERHVVTLEDPVELLFKEDRCVISQREVGTDCLDFQDGLRHALRQSPDVILIGEMRDAETVNAALDAVETGHMVMSTLHTVNAPQTVDRILSFFGADQHDQVRQRLADNIVCVLSQRLLPRLEGGGMVPAFELMVSTPHVRELLLEGGKTAGLARVIEQGNEEGLVSFNQCLRNLVLTRQVGLEDALAASDRPEELVLALRGITGSSGRPDRRGPHAASQDGPARDVGTSGLRLAGND
ncbi:MAG: PilT/PilU family type 4a pilus ATPase [Planctomycetes bacterium]|nr:PilT/PilU family type 4a pilus ATPase [Planctomycetota bacterium]